MKKINLFLIMFSLLFLMFSCKINDDPYYSVESGDFIYATNTSTFGGKEGEIAIIGLTEKGKEEEILIFPNMIDGYKVKQIGAQFALNDTGVIQITNATKVYYCCSLYAKTEIVYCTGDNKIDIYISNSLTKYSFMNSDFVNGTSYVECSSFYEETDFTIQKYKIKAANLAYYIDENNCYFVDYVENENVTVIPPDPYKEGYSFGGWYKDLEYHDKWDFEKDIVPIYDTEYDEEGNVVYTDTKLYAKWI